MAGEGGLVMKESPRRKQQSYDNAWPTQKARPGKHLKTMWVNENYWVAHKPQSVNHFKLCEFTENPNSICKTNNLHSDHIVEVYHFNLTITPLLRQNEIAMSFRRNNDDIITSCICWDATTRHFPSSLRCPHWECGPSQWSEIYTQICTNILSSHYPFPSGALERLLRLLNQFESVYWKWDISFDAFDMIPWLISTSWITVKPLI